MIRESGEARWPTKRTFTSPFPRMANGSKDLVRSNVSAKIQSLTQMRPLFEATTER
jgi:hypothetical protein